MSAPLPVPVVCYTGPVLVDPGNDRPGLHPDYGSWHAAGKAPVAYRRFIRAAPTSRVTRRRRAATLAAAIILVALAIAAAL